MGVDIKIPEFNENETIVSKEDLFNDGTFPEKNADDLLIPKGMKGTVVNVGLVEEQNTHVYMVDFENKLVVGCFENEIERIKQP